MEVGKHERCDPIIYIPGCDRKTKVDPKAAARKAKYYIPPAESDDSESECEPPAEKPAKADAPEKRAARPITRRESPPRRSPPRRNIRKVNVDSDSDSSPADSSSDEDGGAAVHDALPKGRGMPVLRPVSPPRMNIAVAPAARAAPVAAARAAPAPAAVTYWQIVALANWRNVSDGVITERDIEAWWARLSEKQRETFKVGFAEKVARAVRELAVDKDVASHMAMLTEDQYMAYLLDKSWVEVLTAVGDYQQLYAELVSLE